MGNVGGFSCHRMSTRRKFLLDCSAVSLTALAAPPTLLAGTAGPSLWRRSLDDISCEAFASQLRTKFRVFNARGRFIEVTLDRVKVRPDPPVQPGKAPPKDAGHEKFSLFFSGRRDEMLPQETRPFEHEILGRFDCFIVPIHTRDSRRINYEMVCNRRRRERPG
jgi:hypothetical protein